MKLNVGSVVIGVLLILWNFELLGTAGEEIAEPFPLPLLPGPLKRLLEEAVVALKDQIIEEYRKTTKCDTPYTDQDWLTLATTAGRLLSPWAYDLKGDIILTFNGVKEMKRNYDLSRKLNNYFSLEYMIARVQLLFLKELEPRPTVKVVFDKDYEDLGLTVEFSALDGKVVKAVFQVLKERNSNTPVLVKLNGNAFPGGGVVLEEGDFVIMSTEDNSILALPPQNLLDSVKSQGVALVSWMSGFRLGTEGVENIYIARLPAGSFCNVYNNNTTLLPDNNVGFIVVYPA